MNYSISDVIIYYYAMVMDILYVDLLNGTARFSTNNKVNLEKHIDFPHQ